MQVFLVDHFVSPDGEAPYFLEINAVKMPHYADPQAEIQIDHSFC